jgi:hypothetical protein
VVPIIVQIGNADDDSCACTRVEGVSTGTIARSLGEENIHASQPQNACQGKLGPAVHLQVPHQEGRQKTEGEIAECSSNTVDISHGNDVFEAHAGAGDDSSWVLVGAHSLPEEGDRLALQGQHEPEHNTNEASDANDTIDNEFVTLRNCQTKKGECDGDLCQRAGPDVASLAEPPPLVLLANDIPSHEGSWRSRVNLQTLPFRKFSFL